MAFSKTICKTNVMKFTSFSRNFSSKQLSDVYIVSCARTPLGSFQGKIISFLGLDIFHLKLNQQIDDNIFAFCYNLDGSNAYSV